MSFKDLKKMKRDTSINKMLEVAEQSSRRRNFQDDRFWKPTLDKASNGYAVIRFLPAPDGESLPWVKYMSYGFRSHTTGQWYIENSLTSIQKPDPVAELNSRDWATGDKAKQDIVRKRSARTNFVSNILVLKDPGQEQNEGKLFLYRYGKMIHQKIMSAMKPEFDDEVPIDPFNFWDGANFRLKIRHVGDFPNYDKSQFDSSSQLYDGDEQKLEALYNKLYPLMPFVDPNNSEMYKSYSALKARLDHVIGADIVPETVVWETDQPDEDYPATAQKAMEEEQPVAVGSGGDSEEDVQKTLEYFTNLVDNAE